MISILSVNSNCLDCMRLLVATARKFTQVPYEIVIVDNNSEDGSVEWLKEQEGVRAIMLNRNIGHGMGLDFALKNAGRRFCLVLDIDAHLQRESWDSEFIALYKSVPERRLIAAGGGEPKPIHPCFMFFERKFFLENKLSFIARDFHDVGRKIYYDITGLGYEILRIFSGYEPGGEKFYSGAFGDNYYLDGKPTIYHNWYAARMWKKDEVDKYKKKDFEKDSKTLFDQPLVKEILG